NFLVALVVCQGCGRSTETTDTGRSRREATAIVGNAPGLGLNAPGLGLNAPGLGLNAPGLGLNAPGLGLNAPGLGLHAFGDVARQLVQIVDVPFYIVTDELTPILLPVPMPLGDPVGPNCEGKQYSHTTSSGLPILEWRFARTYSLWGSEDCAGGWTQN